MIQVLSSMLSAGKRFQVQNKQYSEKIIVSGTATAGQATLLRTNISNIGHFCCFRITGRFETLSKYNTTTGAPSSSGTICDDGICHLRGLLKDSTGTRIMFNDYVPLDLILSPGRCRSASAANVMVAATNIAAAPAAPNLFYPDEFEYLFKANSEIQIDVKNDGYADCAVDILFHGVRILSSSTVAGV